MPTICYGNYSTNVDEKSKIKELLDEVNSVIPYELVVLCHEYEEGLIFKKKVKWFKVYYKKHDFEAEQLTTNLTEKEAEWFIEGLIIAWKNPLSKLRRVK